MRQVPMERKEVDSGGVEGRWKLCSVLGFCRWFLYIIFTFLLGAICTREALRYDFLIAEKVGVFRVRILVCWGQWLTPVGRGLPPLAVLCGDPWGLSWTEDLGRQRWGEMCRFCFRIPGNRSWFLPTQMQVTRSWGHLFTVTVGATIEECGHSRFPAQ